MKKLEGFDETEEMIDFVKHYLWEEYGEREKLLPDYIEEKGSETLRNIERAVYLRSLDMLWMEHIDNMSHLREGVALRGYSQKDPLIEYKQEGFQMFAELMASIRTNTANTLFKLEFRQQVAAPTMRERRLIRMMTNEDQIERVLGGERNLKEELSENPVVVKMGAGKQSSMPSAPLIGRNEPCSCGSGKKYKKCCGK